MPLSSVLRRNVSFGPSAVKLATKRLRTSWFELARSAGPVVEVLRRADEGRERAVVQRLRERVVGIEPEILPSALA